MTKQFETKEEVKHVSIIEGIDLTTILRTESQKEAKNSILVWLSNFKDLIGFNSGFHNNTLMMYLAGFVKAFDTAKYHESVITLGRIDNMKVAGS